MSIKRRVKRIGAIFFLLILLPLAATIQPLDSVAGDGGASPPFNSPLPLPGGDPDSPPDTTDVDTSETRFGL